MPCRLNTEAYIKLFDEGIAWLMTVERTLERDHIIECLKWMRDNKDIVESKIDIDEANRRREEAFGKPN